MQVEHGCELVLRASSGRLHLQMDACLVCPEVCGWSHTQILISSGSLCSLSCSCFPCKDICPSLQVLFVPPLPHFLTSSFLQNWDRARPFLWEIGPSTHKKVPFSPHYVSLLSLKGERKTIKIPLLPGAFYRFSHYEN